MFTRMTFAAVLALSERRMPSKRSISGRGRGRHLSLPRRSRPTSRVDFGTAPINGFLQRLRHGPRPYLLKSDNDALHITAPSESHQGDFWMISRVSARPRSPYVCRPM